MKEPVQGTESSQGAQAEGTAGTKEWRWETCPPDGISEPWQPELQILIPGCRLEVFMKLGKVNGPKGDAHI